MKDGQGEAVVYGRFIFEIPGDLMCILGSFDVDFCSFRSIKTDKISAEICNCDLLMQQGWAACCASGLHIYCIHSSPG